MVKSKPIKNENVITKPNVPKLNTSNTMKSTIINTKTGKPITEEEEKSLRNQVRRMLIEEKAKLDAEKLKKVDNTNLALVTEKDEPEKSKDDKSKEKEPVKKPEPKKAEEPKKPEPKKSEPKKTEDPKSAKDSKPTPVKGNTSPATTSPLPKNTTSPATTTNVKPKSVSTITGKDDDKAISTDAPEVERPELGREFKVLKQRLFQWLRKDKVPYIEAQNLLATIQRFVDKTVQDGYSRYDFRLTNKYMDKFLQIEDKKQTLPVISEGNKNKPKPDVKKKPAAKPTTKPNNVAPKSKKK